MIEKLSEYKITSRDWDFINADCNTKIINTLVQKINELVDAVNALVYKNDDDSDWYDGQTPAENVPTDKDYITITADDVLVGGESVRKYNGEEIYNYYHLPAYFKEIRDDVAEKGIKLLEIHCLQSSTDGEYAKTGNPTPDKNGCSAWCRCVWEKDGEKHTGAWVFTYTIGSTAVCANYCALNCAVRVRSRSAFRAAVFGDAD